MIEPCVNDVRLKRDELARQLACVLRIGCRNRGKSRAQLAIAGDLRNDSRVTLRACVTHLHTGRLKLRSILSKRTRRLVQREHGLMRESKFMRARGEQRKLSFRSTTGKASNDLHYPRRLRGWIHAQRSRNDARDLTRVWLGCKGKNRVSQRKQSAHAHDRRRASRHAARKSPRESHHAHMQRGTRPDSVCIRAHQRRFPTLA